MFTLKISTANAAFDDEGLEISRILERVAGIVRDVASGPGEYEETIRDSNGNIVGRWELT